MNAASADIGEYLGRRGLKHLADSLDQRVDRLGHGLADIAIGEHHFPRETRNEIAAAYQRFKRRSGGNERSDRMLHCFSRLLPYQYLKFRTHMGDDVLIEFLSRDPYV